MKSRYTRGWGLLKNNGNIILSDPLKIKDQFGIYFEQLSLEQEFDFFQRFVRFRFKA